MNISVPTSNKSSRASAGGVTLEDVAQIVGVTPMTVSRALHNTGRVAERTREAVREAAEQLGYEPNRDAQRLAGGRDQRTIAILPSGLDYDVTLRKVARIQQQLSLRGYSVPINALGAFSQPEAREQTSQLREQRRQKPRAIVCKFGVLHPDAQEEVRHYHGEGGIVISFNDPADGDWDQVLFDREDNSYQAARHLLELGHRDLGFWASSTSRRTVGPRLQGFRRALREFGVAERAEWEFGGGYHLENERSGATLAAQILALPNRPTGMCIVNDSAAQACVAELVRGGLSVPDDISVVSHDDLPIARYSAIPLTAVSHPIEETARAIVEMLCERIECGFDGPPRRLTLCGQLSVRQSTGPPKVATG